MEQDTRAKQPRIFSATSWAYATLPLMGLALPSQVFAKAEDDFTFGASAPEPTLDLIDILPGMVKHFGSTQYQLGRHDLKVAGDGSTYVAPTSAPEPIKDAQAVEVDVPQTDDIAG